VARGAASVREIRDLNALVGEYLQSPEFEKLQLLYPHVTCRHTCDAVRATISCSPVHIQKSVMNLVSNAAEAITGNGTILINTRNEEVDTEQARQLGREAGEFVVLTVRDTGPGIREENMEHIFEPFFTKKKMGKSGTGLGLTVVWNTVEDHQGAITVQSDEQGTCFTLYFPVSEGEEQEGMEATVPKSITGGKEHILVVDDEGQLRDIAFKMLSVLGYQVSVVESGEAAIEFVHSQSVDLMIIDMLMEPGMNGMQTYRKVKSFIPNQKALVTSGFSESEDVKAALVAGVGGFIKKPYSMEQLGTAVRKVLGNS
jgi:CheY-like chemotaxis protein